METKAQLLKEYAIWTDRYMDIHKRVISLLPAWSEIGAEDELPHWIPTQTTLAQFESAKKDVEASLTRLLEIRNKLFKLSQ